uniref:Large ribosomal subunit protein mL45 n=1 Tax=Lepeophtheirus salmonis TaxID=72036 RepID=A0A0K2TNN8_LEPSM
MSLVCSLGLALSRNILSRTLSPRMIVPLREYKMRPNKHRTLQHKKARASKVMKVQLYEADLQRRIETNDPSITPAEKKMFYKIMGILPPTNEKEVKMSYIGSTGALIDTYVPTEGDGKASILSKEGAKEGLTKGTGKGKSFLAARKIRSYEDDFDQKTFLLQAQEIYIKAHKSLVENGEDECLLKYVTEKAYPEMVHNVRRKTLRWEFIKSLEPPTIVHIRTQDLLQKQNKFAQVTVRFHTQQTLAVYDRFGRLIHGSEVVAKDVLEYVVFERHLASIYGSWRLHSKIIPDWAPQKPSSLLTTVLPDYEEGEESSQTEVEVEHDDEAIYDQHGNKMKTSS